MFTLSIIRRQQKVTLLYSPRKDYFITADQVLNSLSDTSIITLDARPTARFTGEQAEPRDGMRSGHIPGSRSLPCQMY